MKMAASKHFESRIFGFTLFLLFVSYGAAQPGTVTDRCPTDYRYRVQTCVMEAQVAPQAGGGLPLVTDRNKLDELCSRGILQKSIDCLRDIYNRCSDNPGRRNELDMLFSIEDWRTGRSLLCEDLNLFKDHFECLSRFGPRISGCILTKTRDFRTAVTRSMLRGEDKTLHDITCNFAENIVTCLDRPLSSACSLQVVETMTSALHRFLPPACAPVPAVIDAGGLHSDGEFAGDEGGGMEDAQTQFEVEQEEQPEAMVQEFVVVEGGEAEN